jgi:hypothetical protein
MKALLTAALFVALGMAFPLIAADKDDLEHLENRVKQLNSLAEKPGMTGVALKTISNETGVPLEKVRNQHKRHPDIGLGGLMVANVLANDTTKGPEHFLSQRDEGKKWLAMAREHKVPVDRLNMRLDRLARAIKGEKADK